MTARYQYRTIIRKPTADGLAVLRIAYNTEDDRHVRWINVPLFQDELRQIALEAIRAMEPPQ